MAGRGRWVAVSLSGMAVAWGLGAFTPSQAASQGVTLTAPYAAAEHNTNINCPDGEPQAVCAATADADPSSGRFSLASSVDSGLNGNAPSSAASAVANGELEADVEIDPAQRLTLAFHLRVADLVQASSKAGRPHLVVWATAGCAGCPTPRTQVAVPTTDGDLTLSVTLTNSSLATQVAQVLLGASADSRLDCDDFCVATAGTARTSATVTLTSVDASPS